MITDEKHIHVWTWGSSMYGWQLCQECGALKDEKEEA